MSNKQYLDYAGLKRVLAKLLPGARKIWHGTQDDWDNLSAAEKAKYDQAEISGNANEGVTYVADTVEEGNMNPVTSDAVAQFLAFEDVSFSKTLGAQGQDYVLINVPVKSGYTAKMVSVNNIFGSIGTGAIICTAALNINATTVTVIIHNQSDAGQDCTGNVTIMYIKN